MAATSSCLEYKDGLKIATFKKLKCIKIKPDRYRGIFRRKGIEANTYTRCAKKE